MMTKTLNNPGVSPTSTSNLIQASKPVRNDSNHVTQGLLIMVDVDSSERQGPAKPKAVSLAQKTPPPERPGSIRQRTLIILSFWAVVVFLGLPLWYKTTTIYRAKLPLGEMMDWAEGRVCGIVSLAVLHLSSVF